MLVQPHVLNHRRDQEAIAELLFSEYGPQPIVFATQRSDGRIEYQGRPDFVDFLADIYLEQLPWKTITVDSAA